MTVLAPELPFRRLFLNFFAQCCAVLPPLVRPCATQLTHAAAHSRLAFHPTVNGWTVSRADLTRIVPHRTKMAAIFIRDEQSDTTV